MILPPFAEYITLVFVVAAEWSIGWFIRHEMRAGRWA